MNNLEIVNLLGSNHWIVFGNLFLSFRLVIIGTIMCIVVSMSGAKLTTAFAGINHGR
jgi:hypothetical protein